MPTYTLPSIMYTVAAGSAARCDEGDMLALDGNTVTVHAGRLAIVSERPEPALATIAAWHVTEAA